MTDTNQYQINKEINYFLSLTDAEIQTLIDEVGDVDPQTLENIAYEFFSNRIPQDN